MTEQIKPREVCRHGTLRRKCYICDLEEQNAALQEAHDHAQEGLRNARKQETEMREKIAALEAEAIKSAERIEEYRSELRERDDRLSGVSVETAALRADKNRLLVSNDRLTEKNDKLEALNAEMLEALREDRAGRPVPETMRQAAEYLDAGGGGPLSDCLRMSATRLAAIIAKAEKGTNAR